MKKIVFRLIHKCIKWIIQGFSWPGYEVINQTKGLNILPKRLKQKAFNKVFIITGPNIYKSGLLTNLEVELNKQQINFHICTEVVNNPTISSIENIVEKFKQDQYDCLIGIGGGSVLDTTKLVGARSTNQKTLRQLKGYFKIKNQLPYMCLVPTTAGSGSEATIAAVLTDDQNKDKFVIGSLKLLPQMIILDETLLKNVPSAVMAYTGMDALTHAMECFIGRANTQETKTKSLKAIKMIFANLEKCINDPSNEVAKKQMLEASFLAGEAFTKGFVGYVHALSHPISGIYNYPHGYVNAIILPYVLKTYGPNIEKDMKEVGCELGIKLLEKTYTEYIIQKIEDLNKKLGIDNKLSILEKDFEKMVTHALKEAHPMYPVPKILSRKELLNIYKEISNSVDF